MNLSDIKTGLRVKLSQQGIKKLCGECGLDGPHLDELFDESNSCMMCSRDHALEFQYSTGTVIGPWHQSDTEFWDVMWDEELRYAYKPEHLEMVVEDKKKPTIDGSPVDSFVGGIYMAADGSDYGIYIVGTLPEVDDFVVMPVTNGRVDYSVDPRRIDFFKASYRYMLNQRIVLGAWGSLNTEQLDTANDA